MAQGNIAFSAKEKERWIERFARFGIISKGIVYCLIGVLASMSALGLQGRKMSKSDAFKLVYDQPFGQVLLILIALGMAGYVMWRFFQAFGDIDNKGSDTKAKFTRVGYAFSGVVYASLAFYATKLALGGPQGGGDGNQRQFIVSKVLAFPAGEWFIGIAAALVFLNGIRQIYKGISGNFCKNVQLIKSDYSDAYKKAGVLGYISRGVVLLVIGYFFLRAALTHNGEEIQGTRGAFDFLENTFGSVLLAIVAVGLIGYGVFQFVKGKYQRIDLNF
jgi:uncharacterized membrane protein YidH (DUF202 family)